MRRCTCVGDFLSWRLGLTLRKPLAASEELLASPFLKPSVALRDRQESGDEVNNINITHCRVLINSPNGVIPSFFFFHFIQLQFTTRNRDLPKSDE